VARRQVIFLYTPRQSPYNTAPVPEGGPICKTMILRLVSVHSDGHSAAGEYTISFLEFLKEEDGYNSTSIPLLKRAGGMSSNKLHFEESLS
jgi:hypothetical protein